MVSCIMNYDVILIYYCNTFPEKKRKKKNSKSLHVQGGLFDSPAKINTNVFNS